VYTPNKAYPQFMPFSHVTPMTFSLLYLHLRIRIPWHSRAV
jgi:hypothetical protein